MRDAACLTFSWARTSLVLPAAPNTLMMVMLLLVMVRPPQPQGQSPDVQLLAGQGEAGLAPATTQHR